MTNEELYQKKMAAIEAQREAERHGSSYDNATTFCFAFILLAIAVAIASFIFWVIQPGDPSMIILWVGYIAAGIFLIFLLTVIIIRILHNRSRKPLVKQRRKLMDEYNDAVRNMLYNDYGLVPVDNAAFDRSLAQNTHGINEPLVLNLMREDGDFPINLTLQEFDNASVVFTRYGVPYRMVPAEEREYRNETAYNEIMSNEENPVEEPSFGQILPQKA